MIQFLQKDVGTSKRIAKILVGPKHLVGVEFAGIEEIEFDCLKGGRPPGIALRPTFGVMREEAVATAVAVKIESQYTSRTG